MTETIAVLNAGSSSIKFALYDGGRDEELKFRGQVEKIGVAPHLVISDAKGRQVAEENWPTEGFDHAAATKVIIARARELAGAARVSAVGHRVVHGGMNYGAPIRVDDGVIAELAKLSPLAPLHQPHNLAPIRTIAEAAPHIVQVACFDTAFHRVQPPLAQLYGLPRKYSDEGVRRYGFHGLSYEYVSARLAELAPDLAKGRVIIAHLGNGASVCAIDGGRSVASTMGFTAVEGLVMGTRCGALDPGVLIYLMDEHGMDARALENLIYKQSGLLGVSGQSSDMRTLRASSDPAAVEAIALFVYRIVREIGSLAAAIGGVDALVFTGGIGEHDAATRASVAAGCQWLGVELHGVRNDGGSGIISTDKSKVSLWVVPTDEERMIARHTSALLAGHSEPIAAERSRK